MGPVAIPQVTLGRTTRSSQVKGERQQPMNFGNGPFNQSTEIFNGNWISDLQPAVYTNAKTVMNYD